MLLFVQVVLVGCSSDDETVQDGGSDFKVVDQSKNNSPQGETTDNEITSPLPVNSGNSGDPLAPNVPAAPNPPQFNLLAAVAQQSNLPVPTNESSVEALQEFITIMMQIPPQGQSQQQQLEFGNIISAELQNLADMLLAKEGLSETERRYGYEVKNTAVLRLHQLGHPKALSMQIAVANEMVADPYEAIAKEGKLLAFITSTQKRLSSAQGKGEIATVAKSLSEEAIGWIDGNEADITVFATLQQIGMYLSQVEPETGNALLNTLGSRFGASENKEISRNANAILEQPLIDASGLMEAARDYTSSDTTERNSDALVASLNTALANPGLGLGTFQILTQIIQSVGTQDAELSFRMMDLTVDSYKKIDDQELATELISELNMLSDQILIDHFKIRESFRFYMQVQTSQGKQDILNAVDLLLKHERTSVDAFGFMGGTADQIANLHPELVTELNKIILASAKSKLNEEDLALLTTQITKTSNRINLIGSTFSIPARTMSGEEFDWASLKGNVVVIDFWATWCGPCLAALPHLEQLQTQYASKGVQFIGFSIDADRKALTDFLKTRELKWPVIIDNIDVEAQKVEDDAVAAAWEMPSATACGINSIPALIILDRTGTVVKMIQSAAELEAVLAGLTSPAPQDSPDSPSPTDSGTRNPVRSPIALSVPHIFHQLTLLSMGQTDDEDSSDLLTGNPYVAAEDADKLELLDYLLDMQDKVKSIRHRDGFAAAVHDAASRLLKLEASDRFHILAVETACNILHEQAALGNEQLDELLTDFISSVADDQRPAIQDQVTFHRLERRVLDSDELEIEKLEILLNDTFTYLEAKTLDDSHLRLASAVVHAVNRYDDDEVRKTQFIRFGKLFSQSQSRTMASYGKKITKSATAPLNPAKLVGQPLELAGVTDQGEELDWDSYRGKIVLIDFWASWCGPCRAQMPKIQALYEELDRKQFDVVAVNLDRDEQALAEYFKEHQSPWPNILGADGRTLAEKYNVTALPTMLVVDEKGTILGVGHSIETLRPIITAAIQK